MFPWGDIDMGEQITCTGRQYLRQMIMFFMKRGYVPLVMDTDGVNFETPPNIDDTVYIGKGLNEMVTLGKEYKGIFPKEIKKQFTTTPQNKQIPVWNV